MFNIQDLKVPILGIVENMSWFSPEKHPEEKYYIFGKGGGHKMAREFDRGSHVTSIIFSYRE